jgi:protein SCO1/2
MNLQKADWLKIILLLSILVGGVYLSYQILVPKPRLPIYNPSDLDRRLVADSLQRVGRNHKVLPFSLVNHTGDTITQANLEGKIYVADFFFTVCPDICKDMAVQKRRLQEIMAQEDDFVIVSHTVTPQIDSVPVMHAYAELQGAQKDKWYLLTGDKPQIYKLARKSYFAVLDEGGNGDESDFIHTENFVLVDKEKRIRGYYDGTSAEEVDRLIKDFKYLKAEYEN